MNAGLQELLLEANAAKMAAPDFRFTNYLYSQQHQTGPTLPQNDAGATSGVSGHFFHRPSLALVP